MSKQVLMNCSFDKALFIKDQEFFQFSGNDNWEHSKQITFTGINFLMKFKKSLKLKDFTVCPPQLPTLAMKEIITFAVIIHQDTGTRKKPVHYCVYLKQGGKQRLIFKSSVILLKSNADVDIFTSELHETTRIWYHKESKLLTVWIGAREETMFVVTLEANADSSVIEKLNLL